MHAWGVWAAKQTKHARFASVQRLRAGIFRHIQVNNLFITYLFAEFSFCKLSFCNVHHCYVHKVVPGTAGWNGSVLARKLSKEWIDENIEVCYNLEFQAEDFT